MSHVDVLTCRGRGPKMGRGAQPPPSSSVRRCSSLQAQTAPAWCWQTLVCDPSGSCSSTSLLHRTCLHPCNKLATASRRSPSGALPKHAF